MTHAYVIYIITVCILIVEIRHLLSTTAARCGEPSTLRGFIGRTTVVNCYGETDNSGKTATAEWNNAPMI